MSADLQRLEAEAAADGAAGLATALRPLRSTLVFMQVGAHPDDECSGLLAYLVRRLGLAVVYACATRGEGGQNAIGPERGDALGLVRTAEMARAADTLGIALRWLGDRPGDPIRDFGFSKSAEDTLRRWGADHALARLVAAIRRERPDMLCPCFLDVDGQHGHHRAVARLTALAFDAAGDPAAFPGQIEAGLTPWTPPLRYLPAWSGGGGSYDDAEPPPPAHVTFDLGEMDPLAGAPYARIGEWSRRFHRSQGMGTWLDDGPRPRALHLAARRDAGGQPVDRIGQSLPATLGDWARLAGANEGVVLLDAQDAIDECLSGPPAAARVRAPLVRALRAVRAALPLAHDNLAHRLVRKEAELSRALWLADRPLPELRFVAARIVAGTGTRATLEPLPPHADMRLDLPDGVSATAAGPGRFDIATRADAAAGTPWNLESDPLGAAGTQGATVATQIDGIDVACRVTPLQALAVVPALSARFRPGLLRAGAPELKAEIEIETRAPLSGGTLSFDGSSGLAPIGEMEVAPDRDGRARLIVGLVPAGEGAMSLECRWNGAALPSVATIDHAHVGALAYVAPAPVPAILRDVALPAGARVASFGGGLDRVGEFLLALGVDVVEFPVFDAARLAGGGFTTALVGIRALARRADLRAGLPALHAFVRNGGSLVTLYHRGDEAWEPGAMPLARIEIGTPSVRWRACEPDAPVRILVPDHPLFAGPNRIGSADWTGWRRERGLHFARSWDPAYVPLLEVADRGEAPHRGSLLAGEIGRGRHVHVSLALHNEIETATPGAVRLLCNLVAPVSG